MLYKLKARIIERFGTQADFSAVIKERESAISRVVRGRAVLSPETQKKWADLLDCKPEDIFPADR